MKAVLVHGAQGTGKTLAASRLAKHFGCSGVLEGDMMQSSRAHSLAKRGIRTLYLTSNEIEYEAASHYPEVFERYTIGEAMAAAGIGGRA